MTPGQVGIYLCGLTVQSTPHIGHLRSAVNYDVLRRWLLHTNHDVTFIRNITDVDDKILDKASASGRPFWAIGAAAAAQSWWSASRAPASRRCSR